MTDKTLTLPIRLLALVQKTASTALADEAPIDAAVTKTALDKLQAITAAHTSDPDREQTVTLADTEAATMRMCFEVAAEGDPAITDADWARVQDAFARAA